VFRDVTSGDNAVPKSQFGPATGGHPTSQGWDACTGLGSINGSGLLQYLQSLPAPALAPAGKP